MQFVALFLCFIAFLIYYFKKSYKYWANRNVPFLKPIFPYGNTDSFFLNGFGLGIKSKAYYDEFKLRGCQFGGVFAVTRPLFVPVDPEVIKNVMSKDFQNFVDRGTFHNVKDDPLSGNLFNIGGTKWRNLRTKLTPTFTSGKMKMMFYTLLDCWKNMEEAVNGMIENNQPIDIKEVVSCFTTDVIGSCAFGIECNSFKNSDAEFRKNGRELLQPSLSRKFLNFISVTFPATAKFLGICNRPKHITKFFMDAIKDTIDYREKNSCTRNDFMQLLVDMKNSPMKLSMNDLAAQVFIFFIAGFETSSTTMTYCLYELAKNQEIQERVRKEINSVLEKHYGNLSYESLSEMKYLRQIIDETLRKYPPVPTLNRDCTSNYRIPETDVVIEKGTGVLISVIGLHRDPEYYPEPEKFDPERFSDENKNKIPAFTYLPFGDGPRNCIGLRFGLMQTSIGLACLLKNYIFSVNPETRNPIRLDPKSFLLLSLDRILLDGKKITN